MWNGKKVLVTGATGLLGSWLCEFLVGKGAEVSVLVKKGDPIGIESIKNLGAKIKIIHGDMTSSSDMNSAVAGQEVIFHLAAVTQVMYSIKNPRETAEVDITGTLNLLEALRKSKSDGFLVFASTDKVYGEPKYLPIDEAHMLNAKSPYDAFKLAADRIVYSYYTTYGIKSAISRCSNIIGGRDSNLARALPSFAYFMLQGYKPIVRTSGSALRDYLYVEDAARAIALLAEKSQASHGEAFNFGTGKPTSVIELARIAMAAFGYGGVEPTVLNKNTGAEITRQYLDAKKAEEKLGWKFLVSLDFAVKKSVEWYSQNKWWLKVMENTAQYYGDDISAMYGNKRERL